MYRLPCELINTVNGHSKKKKEKKGKKCGTSSRHITNLNLSISSFDIYDCVPLVYRTGRCSFHQQQKLRQKVLQDWPQ